MDARTQAEVVQLVERMLAPMRRRLATMVTRGVVSLVDDAHKFQETQVKGLAGDLLPDVEHFAEYGFTSHTPAKDGAGAAEGLLLSVGGARSHSILIAVGDRRFRLQAIAPGEVAVHDDQGQKVHLTRNGIVVNGGGKVVTVQNAPSVELDTPLVHCTGDLTVEGAIDVKGTSLFEQDATVQGNLQVDLNSVLQGTLQVNLSAVVLGALASAASVSDPFGDMGEMRTIYNGHHHFVLNVPGNSGVPLEPMT